ncbi:ATP-binding cassette domain-containing protein [Solicola gregarius]|uniref:ATP-binding cassette domain-containing protein n=1 Tax=Solicola gregarius TaxID=2908642 RepID=A0AA46TK24_9ACTN|nr:ATP-binding cassette domain-containing protein [Solicola gregarius]UYM06726.1 ATP-binding cassette domain-containing protein [Solicola gregarius]
MAVIRADNLGKSYGSKVAVIDLSFQVNPGSVTGFLGPNGSGKSTTMRLMLGLDNGSGNTTYDGQPFQSLNQPMRHVGVLLEAKPFHPTRTARNHLRMLAAANGISTSRVDEVLAMVGLSTVSNGRPKKFSLGMGQRLGMAAALLGDPHTLILDEPANGLDPEGIQWLRNLLKQLAGEGRSVFVSSHLLSEMALLADQLVVIGRGRMIASGQVTDFIRSSDRTSVIVRSPDIERLGPKLAELGGFVEADPEDTGAESGLPRYSVKRLSIEQVGDTAYELGVRLHELFVREATLEEAFLDATERDQEFSGIELPPELAGRQPPSTGAAGPPGQATRRPYGEPEVRPSDGSDREPPPTHDGDRR